MWLISILLFSKNELLLTESKIPRMAVCDVKVDNIRLKYFENIQLSPTIKI